MIAEIGTSTFIMPWEKKVAVADELSQSGHFDFVSDFLKYNGTNRSLIWMVKSLVQRKASSAYIQVVLDNLPFKNIAWNPDHCCAVPLEVLQCRTFETSLSPKKVRRMLSMVREKYYFHGRVSRKIHIFHILIFWEVPEAVLSYFLDHIGPRHKISYEMIEDLVRSPKYSTQFLREYAERPKPLYSWNFVKLLWNYRL